MCVYVFNALMLLIAHQEGQIKKKMAIKVIMYVCDTHVYAVTGLTVIIIIIIIIEIYSAPVTLWPQT